MIQVYDSKENCCGCSACKNICPTGAKVLFSGTPCQIAGLRSYVGKNYDNLLLIDVVCHGVPSPVIFEEYLKFNIHKYDSQIESINFCSKDISIKALKINFKNGKTHVKDASSDLYYKAFSNNIMLRPSCYKCKHNSFRSGSDITLADYWGLQNDLVNTKKRRRESHWLLLNLKKEKVFLN